MPYPVGLPPAVFSVQQGWATDSARGSIRLWLPEGSLSMEGNLWDPRDEDSSPPLPFRLPLSEIGDSVDLRR